MAFTITGAGSPTMVHPENMAIDSAPAVAAIGGGRWAVVWDRGDTIYARLFGPGGTPLTSEFIVAIGDEAGSPRIAPLKDGGFVVVWDASDGTDHDIYARRFGSNGKALGDAFAVNDSDDVDKDPDVAGLTDGGFVVTWSGASGGFPDLDIRQRRFNSDAFPGVESAVPGSSGGMDETAPRVVALGDGWAIASTLIDGTNKDVQLRRFDSEGELFGSDPILVNDPNTLPEVSPVLAALPDGRLVVVWNVAELAKDGGGIFQRVFDPMGVGGALEHVTAGLSGHSFVGPAVTALADGGWLTAFVYKAIGSSDEIYERRYAAGGTAAGPAAGTGGQFSPDVAGLDSGGHVTVFQQTGTGGDILQRITTTVMTTAVDKATGTDGADDLSLAPATLSSGDIVDGMGGLDRLVLSGPGTLDLRLPASLVGVEAIVGSGGADTVVADAARLAPFTTLLGGAGTDTILLAGGGTFSFVGKSLTGFEAIRVDGAAPAALYLGAGPDKAFGGGGKDRLVGNAGNDTLSGGAGNDTAFGGVGNDSVAGEAGKDVLLGDAGNDRLFGGLGVDTLKGGVGKDVLAGGRGRDALTGGKGKDTFVFDTVVKKAEVDRVLDFNVKDDSFRLDNAVFKKLGKGTPAKPVKLGADAFFKGKAGEDKEDRILYDKASGALFYDADGIGSGKAVKVAILKKGLALTHADFFVI